MKIRLIPRSKQVASDKRLNVNTDLKSYILDSEIETFK